MNSLLQQIESLKKSNIKEVIDTRIKEFKAIGEQSSNEIFKELSFCLLTANFNAQRSIQMQKLLGDDFLNLSWDELARKLSVFGHRFPDTRAGYIVEARKYKDDIKETLESFDSEFAMREWIVRNVKGLGYKESSHFLRNVGFGDVAIIDFHIIDLLVKHNLIERPRTLTRKKYMEIENLLRKIAKKAGMTLAELDLYLWYMETGKVLK
jgi:N-glycosylase/DNA lyase